jgi:regulator of cell morphogenesis and NO signaling
MQQDQLALSAVIRCVFKLHHSLLRKELARAADLTGSVVVEQRPPLCRILLPLYRLFQEFRRELEDHLDFQETHLFPLLLSLEAGLRAGERPLPAVDDVSEALRLLGYGQIALTGVINEMRELTHGFTAPPDACECYGELLDVLAWIQTEVASEVRMENSMLVPQTAKLLERVRCRYPGAREQETQVAKRPGMPMPLFGDLPVFIE